MNDTTRTSTLKWVIAGIVLAAALAPSVYFYDKYQGARIELHAVGRAPAETAKELEELVGKHMSLPKETPSIARVSDKTALAGQEFFNKALNGDKVLIYKAAKLAILYRPSTDKIVNVSQISVEPSPTPEKEASGTATPHKTISVAVYNGSTTAGYAKLVKEQIEKAHDEIKVIKLADARGNYAKSVVSYFNDDAKAVATDLAQELKGEILKRPAIEASPAADILVIAGK
ncbi:LytR C-terminal domain-containing protein [Candidatus Microgenomates bacterium]|nr:LytR C-terminal domain-containing protein [Candidatus Microgenomates bacterium]